MTPAESAARAAYAETAAHLSDPAMAPVVTHGLTVLYGPPIQNPDLFLISFQGGGAAPVVYDTWPTRLLYLDDEYSFGPPLRRFAREAGLMGVLETSSMAMPAVFPQAPREDAHSWLRKTGPKMRWRRFSVEWVKRIVAASAPKLVIVFGDKASQALTLCDVWRDTEVALGRGRTFGRAEFVGIPTIYCHHLSQGWSHAEVTRCFAEAKQMLTVLSR